MQLHVCLLSLHGLRCRFYTPPVKLSRLGCFLCVFRFSRRKLRISMAHVIWGREEGQAEAASHCLFLISSYTACSTVFAQSPVLSLFSFLVFWFLSNDLQLDFNVELEFSNNSGVHVFHETTAPSWHRFIKFACYFKTVHFISLMWTQ